MVPTSVVISATDGQLVDRVLAEVVDVEDPLAEVDGVEEPLAEVVGVPAEVVGADDPDFEQPATRSTHAIDETTMAARRQICESKLIESSQCQGSLVAWLSSPHWDGSATAGQHYRAPGHGPGRGPT
ncbi:MAG: hypothetical protein ABSB54_13300 [Acidimicrobiales bacterium]